jgi:hypothetical protein
MKHLLTLAALTALAIAAAPFGRAQLGQSRPPDVPAQSWIQMGPGAGFVVTHDAEGSKFRPNGIAASGYFMGKVDGTWVRLEPVRLGGIVPAT